MKKILLYTTCCITSLIGLKAQNVGINSTGAAPDAGALLDIVSTTKGILIPRVSIADLSTIAPVTGSSTESMLVYNTNATTGKGYHYWDGNDWIPLSQGEDEWELDGNAGTDGGNTTTAGTNFIGTTDAQNLDFRTNNTVRMRVSSLGEFFVGTLNTALPGDLMNGVSNASFPWAINGYSTEDGSGVYGLIQSGTTNYAGVQGEYEGTGNTGAGVRGLIRNTTAGTSFANTINGVQGVGGVDASTAGTYKFGIYGTGGATTRSGGVMGYNFGVTAGALGYYANNGNDYSVYGFGTGYTTGIGGGRMANPLGDFNNTIGLGIYGGVMGGWIKGLAYGSYLSGRDFGTYIDGKSITNEVYVVLNSSSIGTRIPSYASTSLSIDVQSKGVSKLNMGMSRVKFDKSYSELISGEKPIIVTVTPIGESNGVYVVSVDKHGFTVKENNNGNSNVAFNWIAIAEKEVKNDEISTEILSNDFEKNMFGVMHNDNGEYQSKFIWWDGDEVRFEDNAPLDKIETVKFERNKSIKSKMRPKF